MQVKQMKSNEITSTSSLRSYFQTSIKGNSNATLHWLLQLGVNMWLPSLVHFKSKLVA